ncbi:MAG: hypothetical protein ACI8RD_014141, partial [Bacillariaceae sp.]
FQSNETVQSHTRNIEASVEVFSFPSIIALGFQEDQSERRAIQRCKIKKNDSFRLYKYIIGETYFSSSI